MAVVVPQNYIDEWNRLDETARNLTAQGIEQQYMTQKQDVERRKQSLQQEQQKLAQLQAQQAKEEKDVAKMARPGLTKFKARLAGNIDAKTDKEKAEAEAAKQATLKQQQFIQGIQNELQQCVQAFQYTTTQYETLKNTQKFKDDLLERVFTGGLGDEQENRLEHEVALLKPDFTEWGRRVKDDAKALEHMKQGTAFCARSLQFLQQAMQASNMDMVTNIGRNNDMLGMMAQMQKRQALQGASQCMVKASDHVDRAKDFIPEIQRIDPNLVKTIGAFGDIMFDNAFMDMAIAKQIKQSTQRVNVTYQHLQQGTQWVQGRVSENGGRYDDIKRRYIGKVDELRAYRTQLMTQAVNGAGSWNAFSGDRSQFGGAPPNAPPPAYSAYPGEAALPPGDFVNAPPPFIPADSEAAKFDMPPVSGPCVKCNKPLGPDARFCPECGTPASSSAPSMPPPGYPGAQ